MHQDYDVVLKLCVETFCFSVLMMDHNKNPIREVKLCEASLPYHKRGLCPQIRCLFVLMK